MYSSLYRLIEMKYRHSTVYRLSESVLSWAPTECCERQPKATKLGRVSSTQGLEGILGLI